MAFSPNGQTLAFTADALRLWNVGTDDETCILEQPFYKIKSLNFSGNGQVLVSSYGDGTMKVWQKN